MENLGILDAVKNFLTRFMSLPGNPEYIKTSWGEKLYMPVNLTGATHRASERINPGENKEQFLSNSTNTQARSVERNDNANYVREQSGSFRAHNYMLTDDSHGAFEYAERPGG